MRQLFMLMTLSCLFSSGCVAPRSAVPSASVPERLVRLEASFQSFIEAQIVADRPVMADIEAGIEKSRRSLQTLRARYLATLTDADTPRDRVLGMTRIAEMHLDLGARIRRLPYPSDIPAKHVVDAMLSEYAVAPEAIGIGILHQVISFAKRNAYDDRFVRRVVFYLALHEQDGARLDDIGVGFVEHELRGAFAAPPRLLQRGRLGQSAERVSW